MTNLNVGEVVVEGLSREKTVPDLNVGEVVVEAIGGQGAAPDLRVGELVVEYLAPKQALLVGSVMVDMLVPTKDPLIPDATSLKPRTYEAARKARISLLPNRINLVLNPAMVATGTLPIATLSGPMNADVENMSPAVLTYGPGTMEGTKTFTAAVPAGYSAKIEFPQARIPDTLSPITASVYVKVEPDGHTRETGTFLGWGIDYVRTSGEILYDTDLSHHMGDVKGDVFTFANPVATPAGWVVDVSVTNITNTYRDYYYPNVGIALTDGSIAGTTDVDGVFTAYSGTFFQYLVPPEETATATVLIADSQDVLDTDISSFLIFQEDGSQAPVFFWPAPDTGYIRGTALLDHAPTRVSKVRYVPYQGVPENLSIASSPYIMIHCAEDALVTMEAPLVETSWRTQEFFDGSGHGVPWLDPLEYAWDGLPYQSMSKGWPGRLQSVESLRTLLKDFMPFPTPYQIYVTEDPPL